MSSEYHCSGSDNIYHEIFISGGGVEVLMNKRNKALAMIVVSVLVLVIGLSVQSALNQGTSSLSVSPEQQYQLMENQNSVSISGINQLVTHYVNESLNHNHHKSFSAGVKNDVILLNSENNMTRIANYFESQNVNMSQVRVGTSFDQNTGKVQLYIYAEPLSGSLIKRNNYSYLQSYRNLIGFGINNHKEISAPMNIQFTVGVANLTTLSIASNTSTSMSQSQSSFNWDGYQNQYSQNCISSACADITAPGFEIPSYYVACPSYPAISAWVGLSGGSGGTNCLAQTGYQWESIDYNHHPCAFYEIYNAQASCLYPGQSCSDGIQNGNTIAAGVYHVSNGFYFCVADLSNGISWSTTDCAHSFTPHYVQYIVEAPETDKIISQVAKFSSIQFSDMYYWSGQIPLNFVTTFYEQGQYDYYYLSQYYGDQNIGNDMNVQTNTWTATYINSYYNYGYVNGGPCIGGGCVAKGSMILTAKGYRPIQSIKIGTEVYEYNYTSGKMSLGRLLYKNSTFDNATISINNGFLRVTLTNQPIYIVNSSFEGWVINPDHLKVGDYMFDPMNHMLITIYSIKIVEKKIEVYDVITSLFNNFIDHGVLLDMKISNPTV